MQASHVTAAVGHSATESAASSSSTAAAAVATSTATAQLEQLAVITRRIAAVEQEIGEVKAKRDARPEGDALWLEYNCELKQLRTKEEQLRVDLKDARDELRRKEAVSRNDDVSGAGLDLVVRELRAIKFGQQQQSQKLDAALHPQNSSTESDAERGILLTSMCPPGVGLPADADGPPILTTEQHVAICAMFVLPSTQEEKASERHRKQDKANPDAKENTLVALLTPYLAAVCEAAIPGMVLVNSELIKWVHTKLALPSLFQKPDLFVCHGSALVPSQPPVPHGDSRSAQVAHSHRRSSFVFGACAWPLHDCVECIFEAKLQLSDKLHGEVGEIFPKMQNLLRGTHAPSRKCCLFDKHTVHLLEFTSTGLLSRNQFAWTAPGSRAALEAFLRPKVAPAWVRVLEGLCTALRVVVSFEQQEGGPTASASSSAKIKIKPLPPRRAAFLGRGNTGRVFSVRRVGASMDEAPLALKIADTPDHISMLEAEFTKLQALVAAAKQHHPSLLSLCPEVHCENVHILPGRSGAGFLYGPVGQSAETLPRDFVLLDRVLDALLALHRAGFTHGDPRMPNLLHLPSGRFVWIDFRESGMREDEAIRSDLRKCLQSFFHLQEGTFEEATVNSAEEYDVMVADGNADVLEDASRQRWTNIKQQLWQTLGANAL